jgi:hypothetical protein
MEKLNPTLFRKRKIESKKQEILKLEEMKANLVQLDRTLVKPSYKMDRLQEGSEEMLLMSDLNRRS